MNQKTATLVAWIEPDIKEQAEAILSELGIPPSVAINVFYRQVVLHRVLPFAVRLPDSHPLVISTTNREALSDALEVGCEDACAGHSRPQAGALCDLAEEHDV